MEYLSKCPVCLSVDFHNFMFTKDHFLSQEQFTIVECDRCGLRFTNPRPFAAELPAYYESKQYLSHSSEKRGLLNVIYQRVRKVTVVNKFKIIRQWKNGSSLLDIGCGTGEFLKYFSDHGWVTLGIEPGESARNFAVSEYQLHVEPEASLDSIPAGSFDVITLWHVLEHIPQLRDRMEQLSTLLKNDGLLIIAVPNCDSRDARHYGEHWAAWDLPRHLYHFNRKTLLDLATRYPLKLLKVIPMKFDSFYVSLLSEKYKYGKSSYLKAIFYGLQSNLSARNEKYGHSSLIFLFKKHETILSHLNDNTLK